MTLLGTDNALGDEMSQGLKTNKLINHPYVRLH